MTEKAKAPIPLIILIILLGISLCLTAIIFSSLQKERAKTLALQEELNNAKDTQEKLEAELDDTKRKARGLESRLKDNMIQIDSLNKELQQERSEKKQALSQLEQLMTDIEQQKTLRSDLEKKFTQAQNNMEDIQSQLSALESKKTELETKIKELEGKSQGVELGTIVVSPEESGMPAAASEEELAGKVLVVNKDYNFAVINLGSKDGVAMGDEFFVYHDNKYIGDVKVEKVHDSMAAADFISANMKNIIGEDDRIVRKSK